MSPLKATNTSKKVEHHFHHFYFYIRDWMEDYIYWLC